MKFILAYLVAVTLLAGSALAQVPASGTQQKSAPQHQPGTPAATPTPAPDAAPPPLEKLDPAKEASVRRLMEITQTNKMGDNINGAITNQIRQVMGRALQPDQVTPFMDAFTQKLNATAPSSAVTDVVVPIYAAHFTSDDIEGLIRFYESPLGNKVVSTMPQVTQESEMAGIQIGQKAALNILRGMEDQYPELKQMLPPDDGGSGGGNAAPGGAAPAPSPLPPQK